MKLCAEKAPYPENLYRAHNHGYIVPRFVGECFEKYCDSYGSDSRLWSEYNERTETDIPICNPIVDLTVDDVFRELSQHLELTQINQERKINGKGPFLSSFVSLSGDFRWTTQRTCKIGKTASEDQLPGLAIFDTSEIEANEVHIWRVGDMLDFFDEFKAKSPVKFSPDVRRWANNADEYVCWEFVPRPALVAFVPVPELTQVSEGGEAFLRRDFVNSTYLSDFEGRPLETLSFEEYESRASSFMHGIIANVPREKVGRLDTSMLASYVLDRRIWGYHVAAFSPGFEESLHRLRQRWVRSTSGKYS